MDFSQQHVLITGANGGIGEAIAQKFLECGAALVTLHYNSKNDVVNKFKDTYKDRVQIVQANALFEEQVISAVQEASSKLPINILILNHGIYISNHVDIVDMSLEQFNNTLHVNLTGYFLFAREFFKQVKLHKVSQGNIILIGSTAGIFGEAGHADYAASKSLNGFLFSLKNEIVKYIPKGRVNCVAPGWTVTPMAAETVNDKQKMARVYQTIPLKKVATVEDVANSGTCEILCIIIYGVL